MVGETTYNREESQIELALDGRSYPADLPLPTEREQFQDDEAYRAKWMAAERYLETVRS